MMEMSTRYAALQEKLQPTKEEGSIRATNQQAPFYLDMATSAVAAGKIALAVSRGEDIPTGWIVDNQRTKVVAYTAAKDALWALTEVLAVELAPAVRVNGVALGHILAEVSDPPSAAEQLDLDDKRQQLARVPLQRYGTPQEVAAAVAWLLSAESGFVSGSILTLDGARRLA